MQALVQECPQHGSAGLGLTCHCTFSDMALLHLDWPLGPWGLLPPCAPMQKKYDFEVIYFLTVISPTFHSHVPTLPISSTLGMLPNQRQLTLTENDPWMESSSSSQALFPLSPAPLLPCAVWSVSEFPSPAHSVFWGSDFSFLIPLLPLLVLSQTILPSPIQLFQFGLCYFFLYLHLSLCIFYACHIVKICVEAGKELSSAFHTEYG